MKAMRMNDGNIECIREIVDFSELVERYMGEDARNWLDEVLEEAWADKCHAQNLETEVKDLREYHKSVMRILNTYSEDMSELTRAEELDRIELFNTAGAIRMVTRRALNK